MPNNWFISEESTAGIDNALLSVENDNSGGVIYTAGYLHLIADPSLFVQP